MTFEMPADNALPPASSIGPAESEPSESDHGDPPKGSSHSAEQRVDEEIDHKKDYKTTYNDPMKQKEADIIKAGTTEKYSFSVKAVFIFVVGLLIGILYNTSNTILCIKAIDNEKVRFITLKDAKKDASYALLAYALDDQDDPFKNFIKQRKNVDMIPWLYENFENSSTTEESYFIRVRELNMNAMVYRKPDVHGGEVVISFRGTDSTPGLLIDLDIRKRSLVDHEYPDIDVPQNASVLIHQGFMGALLEASGKNATTGEKRIKSVYQEIRARLLKLNKEKELKILKIIGHSLGGAFAQILGYILKFDAKFADVKLIGADDVKVVTFGSPRVGNWEFSNSFLTKQGLVHHRIRHESDPIPMVPALNFYHASNYEYILKTNGHVVMNDDLCRSQFSLGLLGTLLGTTHSLLGKMFSYATETTPSLTPNKVNTHYPKSYIERLMELEKETTTINGEPYDKWDLVYQKDF